ncbi:MAG: YWFCY domain-containing protein, partial [Bacteroidetes bacterium]|nr:YWFCY domain-containing protein [Bacteroidota bacterium]
MQTGENEQGLRKIIDLTRAISIVVLILHFYFYCFTAFEQWHLTAEITTRLMLNIERTGLFSSFNKSKLIAIGFLVISLVGARGRKSENLTYKNALIYSLAGVVLFFCSYFLYKLNLGEDILAIGYITMTCLGYVLFLTGGTLFSRIIKVKLSDDVFNSLNETFPQEERLLTNEYSINLPAVYNLKGKQRKSWVNVINPLRGLLIMGSPGSGKSYFIIQHIIKQHIQKGFSMFIYDFKYDDLSKIAYNYYLATVNAYPIKPQFYAINFDDLSKSSRCNPLDVGSMRDITDAAESSRTIMLGLNQEWIQKQGDFFVESPINFVTALIWFLRSFQQGKYCTLAHVIELAQTPYKKLFSVLRSEPQIEALINPFVTAYLNGAKEQLEGQVASATISLARLSSPQLYYILNGNDLTLDVSNPKSPKIV